MLRMASTDCYTMFDALLIPAVASWKTLASSRVKSRLFWAPSGS